MTGPAETDDPMVLARVETDTDRGDPAEREAVYAVFRQARNAPFAARGWAVVAAAEDGRAYLHKDGLRVIESVAQESDGRWWLHVSASREGRVPTWQDMMRVKREFIGPDREAYMIAPPEDRYVNLHSHVLHWWSCLEAPRGEVLPRFEGVVAESTHPLVPRGTRTI